MKILAVQPYGDAYGHYAKATSRICQELVSLGHEVVLCANTIETGPYIDGAPKFRLVTLGPRYAFAPYDQLRPRSTARWMIGRIKNNVATLRLASRIARVERFDIVHVFNHELVTMWAAKAIHLIDLPPTVIEISAANFEAKHYPGGRAARLWKGWQGEAARQLMGKTVRGVSLNSQSHEAALRRQLRLPATFPMAVMGDASETEPPIKGNAAARADAGVPVDTFNFLMFGTLRVDRGIGTLLGALERLRGNDGISVTIAGAPVDFTAEDMANRVALLNGKPYVRLVLRFITEAEASLAFQAADAVLLPYSSSYFGSSGPLFNAVAYGKPVLASDVSEMGELVRAHGLGRLVPPDDADALASAIIRMSTETPSVWSLYQSRAQAFAASHSRRAMAESLVELYERILVNESVANRDNG